MERVKCPNCGSHNSHPTAAHASNELDYWQQMHCFNCGHRWFARQETQETKPALQIDVLAVVIDNLRNLGVRDDKEIEALEDILDLLLTMQKEGK